MATPFPFVSGAVLQASQLNAITELPTRTLTANGAAVAADSYSQVILNGTSITYTINTSTFTAGQVVEIYNANSTTATIAAGAGITLNGAAGLTLAQYQSGTLYAVSATSFILFKSNVTQTAAGFELVSSTTIGSAVSTVTVSNAFSSTYDNYRIMFGGGTTSTTNQFLVTLGASTTGYYRATFGRTYANTDNSGAGANAANFVIQTGSAGFAISLDVFSPFLAVPTGFIAASPQFSTGDGAFVPLGYHTASTSYTAFTITTNTGTITGGTIKVYGYKN